jgi:predicted transposase/invertase (TIGR01784 family)
MSEELVCKPSLDIVFKKLFTEHIDLLEDFLSLALETEIEELELKTFPNTELLPDRFNEKLVRVDVLLKTKNGEKINVEIQNRDKGNYKERSVYYCSKPFGIDLGSGKDYIEIPKTICINILQFKLFEGEHYRNTVFPTIQETAEVVTDKWEIIYFETPKLPGEITNRLERWLKFFTVNTEEALINMERMNDTAIKKASIVVKEMNADEQMREIARTREDSQVLEGMIRFEGYKDGKMHGRMEGLQQGIQQGMKRGIDQANLTTARNMLIGNIPFADIAKFTGLPISTIESLTQNH